MNNVNYSAAKVGDALGSRRALPPVNGLERGELAGRTVVRERVGARVGGLLNVGAGVGRRVDCGTGNLQSV